MAMGGGGTAPKKGSAKGNMGYPASGLGQKVCIGHRGQVRSQGEAWEVGGCCSCRGGSCGWCKKLKRGGGGGRGLLGRALFLLVAFCTWGREESCPS